MSWGSVIFHGSPPWSRTRALDSYGARQPCEEITDHSACPEDITSDQNCKLKVTWINYRIDNAVKVDVMRHDVHLGRFGLTIYSRKY